MVLLFNCRPNIKEILLQIAPECFNRWFDIGILLDVPVQKMRDIKFSDNTQPDVCCVRMFTEWLDGDANPTWATLSKAVDLVSSSTPVVEESDLTNLCGKGQAYIYIINYAIIVLYQKVQ